MTVWEATMKLMITNCSDLEKLVALDMLEHGYIPFNETDVKKYWSERL